MTITTPQIIPLDERDALRFEKLMLQQQLLQQQLQILEQQKELLWRDLEYRYQVKGYQLDLANKCLRVPEGEGQET